MKPDYEKRRQTLRDRTHDGVLVLHRGGEHFNENLFYLTGLDSFYTTLIMSLESEFECLLVNEIEYPIVREESDIDHIIGLPIEDTERKIVSVLESLSTQTIYTDYSVMSKTPIPAEIILALQRTFSGITVRDVPEHLNRMRLIKDPYEIATMKRGVRTIEEIFTRLGDMIRPGVSERTLSAEIHRQLVEGGFNKFYDIMVASGNNSAAPYYRKNNSPLPDRGVILIDIAAAIDYYVCDITRTYAVGKNIDQNTERIMNVVQNVHNSMLELAVPGQSFQELNAVAYELFKESGLEEFYYNKLGHFIGLGVADPGDDNTIFEKGMVVTIEPGLYRRQWGVGVRREDMVFL